MKILLATVPPWLPYHQYLSIPLLTGILKDKGYDVIQKDYNVEFYDVLLSESELDEQFKLFANEQNTHVEQKKRDLIEVSDYLIKNIDNLKAFVKNPESYGHENEIQDSFELLDLALKSYSLNFSDIELSLGEVKYLFDYYNIDNLFDYVLGKSNIFDYYYCKCHLSEIKENTPDIVGFSITTLEQLIPALSFAKILKASSPAIKIFLGGSYISRVAHNLISDERFHGLIDFVLRGYSENTILDLIRAFENNYGFDKIEGIIYCKQKSVISNPPPVYKFTDNVVSPDFDGLNFDLYFTPNRKLPVELSKGCYWGKCKFCELNGEVYTAKSAKRIFSEIEYLHSKYDVSHFNFVSASPSPKLLHQLAVLIKNASLNVTWSTMVRPESYIDEDFARTLFDGGMRLAKIGFESGSQKMLDAMNKGLSVESNKNVLKALYSAGINVHGYFMYGYYDENDKDIGETKTFIEENQSHLTSLATSYYTEIYKTTNGLRIYKIRDNSHIIKIENILK